MWILLLLACAHRVTIVSNPPAATVASEGDTRGVTPLTLTIKPYRPQTVIVRHPGYRPIAITLRRGLRIHPRTVEVRLVEEHGGVGTWEPEDVP